MPHFTCKAKSINATIHTIEQNPITFHPNPLIYKQLTSHECMPLPIIHRARNQRWVWTTWWWCLRWVSCYFSFLGLLLPAWIWATSKVMIFTSLQKWKHAVIAAYATGKCPLIAIVKMLGWIHAIQLVKPVLVHAQSLPTVVAMTPPTSAIHLARAVRMKITRNELVFTMYQMDKAPLGFAYIMYAKS